MADQQLTDLIAQALRACADAGTLPACEIEIALEQPPKPEMGDFSCNIALRMSGEAQMKPRDVAQAIIDALPACGLVDRCEIAGPGFINFHLSPTWLQDAVRDVLLLGERYGTSTAGAGTKVQVEFVSANPVGPLHVGNARGGPYGDAVANLLEAAGHEVEREYLLNDGPDNTQFVLFGASVQARVREILGREFEIPENGYRGEYVIDFARALLERHGAEKLGAIPNDPSGHDEMALLAEEVVVEHIRETLAMLGIEYQSWFSERKLFEAGTVGAKIEDLRRRGVVYEKDGALWLRTTDFGDEEDRVLVRSNGAKTYLMTDLAYVDDKLARGFDHCIYVWGPDHAAQVPSVKAGMAAAGVDPAVTEFIIHQIVRLTEGGEIVKMSKRAGKIVTLRQLIEEVGADVTRFFLLSRSVDAHLDFDLDLARKESEENPVYYVQYAHARISSILREARAKGLSTEDLHEADLSLLQHADEMRLMRWMADYPGEVLDAAIWRAPHRIAHLSRDLAATFHQFYGTCRVIDLEAPELSRARLALVSAARTVLANMLGLLGISAPETM
ncbi:MAG TPA: arginine--tRNA ligase [Armatimonadetes bacterium]|nr:arginine--tRNA ligase [Armatimonadota bacterium]